MSIPYRLNKYQSKADFLTNQAKSILDFCIENRKVNDFYKRISDEVKLNKDTIQVLKDAILAGYYNSIYTYSWDYEDELKLWELINSKCDEDDKIYFLLANFQKGNKDFEELKVLYFKAFNQNINYLFSLEDEDRELFYDCESTRYEFLKLDFEAKVTQWDDFEDNWNGGIYWVKKFEGDKRALEIIHKMLGDKRN